MTLGELMVLTRETIRVRPQIVSFNPDRGIHVSCTAKMHEKWGPYADRKVTGIRALDRDMIVVFVKQTESGEDPQIPGQMDLSDYGIRGG